MRIGELAERAGTSTRTLRYYEQHGLLCARRTSNGYREYDEVDLRLVREIRSLLEIGFNLEETRPFVECLRTGHDTGAECPASIEVLIRKLTDLDICIARLTDVRRKVHQDLVAAASAPPVAVPPAAAAIPPGFRISLPSLLPSPLSSLLSSPPPSPASSAPAGAPPAPTSHEECTP